MIPVPAVGSHVRVQTCWGTYTGSVVPNAKWEKPDTFCMTGDQHIAVRNIRLANVATIEYVKGAPLRDSVRAFRVKSTDGKRVYHVIVRGDKFSCDCLGFTYRQKCRHVEGVKSKIAK